MSILLALVYFLAGLVGMEGVAWFTHKYIMHGFLWYFHSDHHIKGKKRKLMERNDIFGLFFAGISAGLIVHGAEGLKPTFFLGLGVGGYGLAYVLFHDIFVHRRAPILKKSRLPYLNMLRRAHHFHHEVESRQGAQAFGFFYVSPQLRKRFWKNH